MRADHAVQRWSCVFISLLLLESSLSHVWAIEDTLVEPGIRALQSWLAYAEIHTSEDGQAIPSLASNNVVRGTAILGQLVTGLHVGLLDSPSLLLLNRIAGYINTQVR